MKKRTRDLTIAAVIAAIYAVITMFLTYPMSYQASQFRVAEALTILPYFTPAAIPGLFLGWN